MSTGGSHSDGLPPSNEVVSEFRRAVRDPAHRPARNPVGLLVDLLRSNLEQWNLESETRDARADDAAVARAKRAIDELNAGRHQLVEAIDAVIDDALTQDPSATVATESPAMAFDRLSVLAIRIHQTERAAAERGPDADRYAARLPVLRRQLAELEQAIDCLVEDVRQGRRRFVPYQSLKLYGR